MDKKEILKFIGSNSMSIVEAMTKIDANEKGILFVVDSDDRLIGCITDGDIRRWLIKTGDLSASVENVMNKNPMQIEKVNIEQADKLFTEKKITALAVTLDETVVDVLFATSSGEQISIKHKGDLAGIPVVIMAGGKGTRLYPYTKILPKPLIPIGDTPILERILNSFYEYKIDDFYLTVNYKSGMIKSYFADGSFPYRVNYIDETIPLGTGGSLKLIKEGFTTPIFVSNCDSLVIADYSEIFDYHINANNAITVVAALKNVTIPYGVMHTKENGELVTMEEKPKLSYMINTGMYIVSPDMIKKIPDNQMYHMTHLIEQAMKDGEKVGVYPISEDSFLDMGEFSEMKRMEEKLHIIGE